MYRIIVLIILFLVLLAGLSFYVQNAQLAMLNYYLGSIKLPVSILVGLSLLMGAVLGILASCSALLRLRHELGRMQRQLSLAEKEVNNLRAIPIKDMP